MTIRCLFGHDYREVSRRAYSEDGRPDAELSGTAGSARFYARVYGECSRCGRRVTGTAFVAEGDGWSAPFQGPEQIDWRA